MKCKCCGKTIENVENAYKVERFVEIKPLTSDVNCEKIYPGLVYDSYKDMCRIVKEDVKIGRAKEQQLDNWRRFFDWEVQGRKWVITKFFEEIKKPETKTVVETDYYCSEDEYKKQERKKADHKELYETICDILGFKEIVNTILFKEWTEWNKVATDAEILAYLKEKSNVRNALSLPQISSASEFNKIRYISAILKNNLQDYVKDYREKKRNEEYISKKKDTFDFYEPVVQTETKERQSFGEVEDDIL